MSVVSALCGSRRSSFPTPLKLYTAEDVQRIRIRLNMSQAGFARLLQVSSKTVQS